MSERTGRFRLSDMEFDFVSLVPAGDDPMAQVVIAKADPASVGKGARGNASPSVLPASNDLLEDKMANIAKDGLAPEVVAYIDGLEAENDTLAAQVEKSETDLADKDAEIVVKSDEITGLKDTLSKSAPLDPAAAEKDLLSKADPVLRGIIEKAQKTAAEATEIAKAERDVRLTAEYISKAAALPMINESTEGLAGLLRRAADVLTVEDNAALSTVLKAANEQIAKSNLFASLGSGGAETTISKSVTAQAQELMKADSSLTKAQAEAKVYDTNPDLFAQAMTDQEG